MVSTVGTGILLLVAAIRVEGNISCPAPADVEAQLAEWLPPKNAGDDSHRARLVDDGDDLLVRLEGPDGVALDTRRFSRTYSCRELVSAVSVTIAAWQSDVHPDFAPALGSGLTKSALPLARAGVTASPAASPPAETATLAVPAPRAPQRWALAAGGSIGIGAALDLPAPAGAATIGMWLTPPDARTAARFEIEGQSQRQIAVSGGRASWQRVTAGLGLERPFVSAADGDDGAVLHWFALARLGWLGLRGDGFATNRSDNAPDAGGTLGLRKAFLKGRWSFWGELAMSIWPIRHDLIGPSVADAARLPVVEAFVRIGAAGGTRR